MRLKKVWTLLLLTAMSFSVLHAYAYAALEDDHCSVSEYVQELCEPVDCGDICDFHAEYHTSYILPGNYLLPEHVGLSGTLFDFNERLPSHHTVSLFKPPIHSL